VSNVDSARGVIRGRGGKREHLPGDCDQRRPPSEVSGGEHQRHVPGGLTNSKLDGDVQGAGRVCDNVHATGHKRHGEPFAERQKPPRHLT